MNAQATHPRLRRWIVNAETGIALATWTDRDGLTFLVVIDAAGEWLCEGIRAGVKKGLALKWYRGYFRKEVKQAQGWQFRYNAPPIPPPSAISNLKSQILPSTDDRPLPTEDCPK